MIENLNSASRRGRKKGVKNAPKDTAEICQPASFPEKGRLYRLRQLANYPGCAPGPIGRSAASIWNDIKAGRFPAPVQIGPGAVAWKGEDIQKWLDSLSPARKGGA